ncbi:MAG: Gfo/Idh/MocA family oxidoreductase [Armatimonadetes bacterium]|nr:Gfo/Idh/MocA family oxidoreductase [Armatimonadota bacterium]
MGGRIYGFAVIGCGNISDTHCEALQRLENARLVAVVDTVEEAARAKAEKWGCEWSTDLDRTLEREDIDVVNVVVPSGLHAEIGIRAAQAGKHVICTKPIDVTLDAIDRLIVACREAGVKLGATHQFRSYPVYRRIKQAIEDGRLGKLLYGSALVPWYRSPEYYAGTWRGTWALDGGGALMNQSIHYVDLLVWLLGDVAEVAGFTDTMVHDIETEDAATAALKFRNGAHGAIRGATCTYRGYPARLEVHGERGTVQVVGEELRLWDVEGEEVEDNPQAGREGGASDPMKGMVGLAVKAHMEQIADLLRAIEENREPQLNGVEARRAVEVILAVYKSSQERRVVPLPLKPSP